EGSKDKPKEPLANAPPADTRVVAKVAGAALAKTQPGSIPREVAGEVAKLKGSTIQFTVGRNGVVGEFKSQLSKDASPQLASMLDGLADGLSALWTPVPDKPVGSGAYWITTDRATSLGIDVLRYRVFRVQKVQGDTASVTIDTRQYA